MTWHTAWKIVAVLIYLAIALAVLMLLGKVVFAS